MNVYHTDPAINAEVVADAHVAEALDLAAGCPPRWWTCDCGASHQRGHFLGVASLKERALVRSATQVRALLAGATQVRVPVVPQPRSHAHDGTRDIGIVRMEDGSWMWECSCGYDQPTRCPLGVPGDRLYVKETWGSLLSAMYEPDAEGVHFKRQPDCPSRCAVYRADGEGDELIYRPERWFSAATMPSWAARLILEVVEVRAQQGVAVLVRDIEAEGFLAEGRPSPSENQTAAAVNAFEADWNARYAKRGLAWTPDLWTFAAVVRRVESATC